jgi:ADP-heptose:LPS heptosyltransferase
MLNARAPSPDVILGKETIHSAEQQLALLHWAGVPFPAAPKLYLTVSEEIQSGIIDRLIAAGLATGSSTEKVKSFAVMAPSAAFESKRWPTSGFAAVVDHLKEKYELPTVLIAGPGHERIVSAVQEQAESPTIIMTGLDLKEIKALISLSSLYIGNDSGPMHIAAAFDRPTVVLFGSSNPSVWRPWTSAPSRVVGTGQQTGTQDAINSISASRVIENVDEVLNLALVADCGTTSHRNG